MSTEVVDYLFSLFQRFGASRYGEDITQLEHALQCAQLAHEDGAPETMIAAALLHDIGQFIDDAGNAAEAHGFDACHEDTGAALLARHFPLAVTEPVRLHVAAKRYLCAVEPDYFGGLSRASRISLDVQGGPFTANEAQQFAGNAFFKDALQLRHYDDGGKRPGWAVPDLEAYRDLITRLVQH